MVFKKYIFSGATELCCAFLITLSAVSANAATAAPIERSISPGLSWEYNLLHISEPGFSFENQRHKVYIDAIEMIDDTLIVMTSEMRYGFAGYVIYGYEENGTPVEGPKDSVTAFLDTVRWHCSYRLDYNLVQLDTSFKRSPHDTMKFNELTGILPDIFPGVYYNGSYEFSLLYNNASYLDIEAQPFASCWYHQNIGLITSSSYSRGSASASRYTQTILFYRDQSVDAHAAENYFTSVKFHLSAMKASTNAAHGSAAFDFLGRTVPAMLSHSRIPVVIIQNGSRGSIKTNGLYEP